MRQAVNVKKRIALSFCYVYSGATDQFPVITRNEALTDFSLNSDITIVIAEILNLAHPGLSNEHKPRQKS